MATGTLHPGKQSLLGIVRFPQDDNTIITPPYLKSKPNFGNSYTLFGGRRRHRSLRIWLRNGSWALIRKDLWKHKDHVGSHYVTNYYTGGYDKHASINSEARYISQGQSTTSVSGTGCGQSKTFFLFFLFSVAMFSECRYCVFCWRVLRQMDSQGWEELNSC